MKAEPAVILSVLARTAVDESDISAAEHECIKAELLETDGSPSPHADRLYWMTVAYFQQILKAFLESGQVPKTDFCMQAVAKSVVVARCPDPKPLEPKQVEKTEETSGGGAQMGLFG